MCHESVLHLCVPATEKILRTVGVYMFLVIGFRLAGKRELAQLRAPDLVVLITIANAVQNAIIGPDNSLTGGLIGGVTLLVTNYAMSQLTYRVPAANRLLLGKETVLYEDGALHEDALRHELITKSELRSTAASKGVHDFRDAKKIALEPNGNLDIELQDNISLGTLLTEIRELKAMVRAQR